MLSAWVRFLLARSVLEKLLNGIETDVMVFKIIFLTGKMAQWVMVIAVKPGDLNLVPRTLIVKYRSVLAQASKTNFSEQRRFVCPRGREGKE